jgi:hypothetical protein
MRTRLLLSLVAVACLALLMGCVSTIDGRKQAGISFSKSTVEGRYNVKTQELWQAAKAVLKQLGTITTDDITRNVLEAKIDTRTVWVKVEQVDDKLSLLTVQARSSGGGGDLDLAIFVDRQIAVRVTATNLSPAPPTSERPDPG